MQISLDASNHDLLSGGAAQSADIYQHSGGIYCLRHQSRKEATREICV